jgi:hypothetical protein
MQLQVDRNRRGDLTAIFRLTQPEPILVELHVRLADGADRKALAELSKMIDNARHGSSSHCAECDWRELMALVSHCHLVLAGSSKGEVNLRVSYGTSERLRIVAGASGGGAVPLR